LRLEVGAAAKAVAQRVEPNGARLAAERLIHRVASAARPVAD
jgi:hypothetical protein